MSSFNWAEETEKEQQAQQAATTSSSQSQNERLLAHSDIQKFEDLNLPEDLLKGIYAKGYNRPSNIQGKALPVILKEDVNLIAQSQSGTGKTATFGIGMLCAVEKSLKQPQAICCCPTYELGLQIFQHVKELAQYTGITVGTALKGVDLSEDMSFQVIVATPGTLMSLLLRKKNFDVSRVKMLVVDEADQMIEATSFQTDLGKIKQKLPKNIRVLLFSATFAEGELGQNTKEKEEAIMKFAKTIVPPPFRTLLIPKEELTLDNMKQFYVNCGNKEGKFTLLKEIYEGLSVGQSIIFLNRKDETEELLQRLTKEGFKVAKLTGEMEAAQRKAVIEDFRTGKAKVLLSTNVLSRGLDIDTVTHVLNYDLPFPLRRGPQQEEPDFATYLHRIGRTARYGRKGVAINFIGGPRDMAMVKAFEKYFKREIKEVKTEDVIEEIK